MNKQFSQSSPWITDQFDANWRQTIPPNELEATELFINSTYPDSRLTIVRLVPVLRGFEMQKEYFQFYPGNPAGIDNPVLDRTFKGYVRAHAYNEVTLKWGNPDKFAVLNVTFDTGLIIVTALTAGMSEEDVYEDTESILQERRHVDTFDQSDLRMPRHKDKFDNPNAGWPWEDQREMPKHSGTYFGSVNFDQAKLTKDLARGQLGSYHEYNLPDWFLDLDIDKNHECVCGGTNPLCPTSNWMFERRVERGIADPQKDRSNAAAWYRNLKKGPSSSSHYADELPPQLLDALLDAGISQCPSCNTEDCSVSRKLQRRMNVRMTGQIFDPDDMIGHSIPRHAFEPPIRGRRFYAEEGFPPFIRECIEKDGRSPYDPNIVAIDISLDNGRPMVLNVGIMDKQGRNWADPETESDNTGLPDLNEILGQLLGGGNRSRTRSHGIGGGTPVQQDRPLTKADVLQILKDHENDPKVKMNRQLEAAKGAQMVINGLLERPAVKAGVLGFVVIGTILAIIGAVIGLIWKTGKLAWKWVVKPTMVILTFVNLPVAYLAWTMDPNDFMYMAFMGCVTGWGIFLTADFLFGVATGHKMYLPIHNTAHARGILTRFWMTLAWLTIVNFLREVWKTPGQIVKILLDVQFREVVYMDELHLPCQYNPVVHFVANLVTNIVDAYHALVHEYSAEEVLNGVYDWEIVRWFANAGQWLRHDFVEEIARLKNATIKHETRIMILGYAKTYPQRYVILARLGHWVSMRLASLTRFALRIHFDRFWWLLTTTDDNRQWSRDHDIPVWPDRAALFVFDTVSFGIALAKGIWGFFVYTFGDRDNIVKEAGVEVEPFIDHEVEENKD